MLPDDPLLQVLHFADYRTLVFSKLAEGRFLNVGIKFAEKLARRRHFRVTFYDTCIFYAEDAIVEEMIRYERGNQSSLAAACRELAGVIGPHAVAKLTFYGKAWTMSGVVVVVKAAPLLTHAKVVGLSNSHSSNAVINSEVLMQSFIGMKSLILCIAEGVFCAFTSTFIRRQSASELRLIKVRVFPFVPSEGTARSVEELVRHWITLPRLQGGEALELDFSNNKFSASFGLRIIELLKYSGRRIVFRFLLCDSELLLDESDYTVDVDGATTRYTSEKSGIIVEVEHGRWATIESTAEVPRKERNH